jgi:hypothetical protein
MELGIAGKWPWRGGPSKGLGFGRPLPGAFETERLLSPAHGDGTGTR